MSSRPFMQLYIADYLGDTQHLTIEQSGCYLHLLMTMWRAGGRLPNDPAKLARIVRLSTAKWLRIAGDVMAFFEVVGDEITQKRLAAEIEKSQEKSQVRAAAGAAGGRAKALKDNKTALANATDLPCHSSDIRDQTEPNGSDLSVRKEPTRVKARHAYPEAFDRFWREYPRDPNMSKTEAFDVWKRLPSDERDAALAALPAFKRYCRENTTYRPVHACRFLSKNRAEGFLEAAAAKPQKTGWPLSADEPTARAAWLRGSWPSSFGPAPGMPGCKIPDQIQREWLAEKANLASNAA